MILTHPNINKPPKAFQRMCERAMEIDAFLKMDGVNVFQTLNTVSISFPSKIAADEFLKVMKRGVRGT